MKKKLVCFGLSLFFALSFLASNMEPIRVEALDLPGYAMQFDGVNDYARVLHNTTLEPTSITLSFWIKPQVEELLDYQTILTKANDDPWGFNCGYSVTLDVGFTLGFNWLTAGGIEGCGSSYLPGVWQHWLFRYNATSHYGHAYRNGVLVDTKDTSQTNILYPTHQNLTIGEAQDNNYWYNGTLDDLQIYSRVVTTTEIAYLYNAGVGRYSMLNSNGLILWWKFDEGSGTKLYDRSGNYFHATTYGPTWVAGKSPDWYSIDMFYIQPNYNGTLNGASYSTFKLTFTISAPSTHTSITKIYTGIQDGPHDISGASSWSYDYATRILTITKVHSSSAIITVTWTMPQPSWSSIVTNFNTALIILAIFPILGMTALVVVAIRTMGHVDLFLIVTFIGLTVLIIMSVVILNLTFISFSG